MIKDSIIDVIRSGWTSSQFVIDSIPEHSAERIKYELRELTARKQLITRHGQFGLEYALPETPDVRLPPEELRPFIGKPVSKGKDENIANLRRLAVNGRLPEDHTARRFSPISKVPDCRRALLGGALDDRPRSNIDLRSRVLSIIDVSQTLMSQVLRDLVAEGRVEKLGSNNSIKFRLLSEPQPSTAIRTADQPTVSDAAPPAAQDNNGGRETAEPHQPSATPDGAAGHSPGCAEPPEDLFALYSYGRLLLLSRGEGIVLSREATQKLFTYLSNIGFGVAIEDRV